VTAGFIEQDYAILVDDTLRIFTRTDEADKRLKEPCGFQRNLTVVWVDVEQAALRSCTSRSFGFVYGRCDTVKM
jgi:hypothetical protein